MKLINNLFNLALIILLESQWTVPQVSKISSNRLHIQIAAFNRQFSLDLNASQFLSSNYQEATISRKGANLTAPSVNQPAVSSNQNNDQFNIIVPHFLLQNWCHYQGNVIDADPSWAAISYCNNKLNGIFETDGVTYHLQQSPSSGKVNIFTYTSKYHCGAFVMRE